MAKKLKKRRKGINYQTIKIKNDIINDLNTIQEKIHYLSQEFRDEFAEESVGKVAEETEVVFVNDSQKENFSLVEFDSATADTLDGSTCVKEIVSKEKSKKSLGVYETLLKKIDVCNTNIKKVSVNNLKLKICEWIDKENKFNKTSEKIKLDLKEKFGISNIVLLKGLLTKRPNFFERNLPFWLLPTRNSRDKSREWTKLKKELKKENKKIDPGKYLSDKYKYKINEWNKIRLFSAFMW